MNVIEYWEQKQDYNRDCYNLLKAIIKHSDMEIMNIGGMDYICIPPKKFMQIIKDIRKDKGE